LFVNYFSIETAKNETSNLPEQLLQNLLQSLHGAPMAKPANQQPPALRCKGGQGGHAAQQQEQGDSPTQFKCERNPNMIWENMKMGCCGAK